MRTDKLTTDVEVARDQDSNIDLQQTTDLKTTSDVNLENTQTLEFSADVRTVTSSFIKGDSEALDDYNTFERAL